jgi:hypothetical protein
MVDISKEEAAELFEGWFTNLTKDNEFYAISVGGPKYASAYIVRWLNERGYKVVKFDKGDMQ